MPTWRGYMTYPLPQKPNKGQKTISAQPWKRLGFGKIYVPIVP